jgi:hypothetical protein
MTTAVATATVQRAPDQQRQQQGEDAGQHHDDARNMRIQDVGERCGDCKAQDRPGHYQSDADAGTHHRPTVHGLDEAEAVHRCAVRGPTLAVRLVTR